MPVEEWKRWVRKKWSLWKHAGPAAANAIISFGCYIIGWKFSTVNDSGPLVHAGAFATVTSIVFALYDYRSALADGEKSVVELFASITAHLPYTGAQSLANISSMAGRNTRRAGRAITLLQASLLIVATLVWRFADIAPKWAPWAFRSVPVSPTTKHPSGDRPAVRVPPAPRTIPLTEPKNAPYQPMSRPRGPNSHSISQSPRLTAGALSLL